MKNIVVASYIIFAAIAPAFAYAVDLESYATDAYQFETLRTEVVVPNPGPDALRIMAAEDNDGRVKLADVAVVPAHSTKSVRVDIDLRNDLGLKNYRGTLRVDHDEPIPFVVHTFVQSILDQERPVIDFGVVARGLEPSKRLGLSSREVANFAITEIVDTPTWMAAEIGADHLSIDAKVRSDRPLGMVDGFVKLKTNSSKQPFVWVLAKMDSRGAVVPDQNPVDFSMLRQGAGGERKIRLEENLRKPFSVDSVRIEGSKITGSVVPCEPDTVWCKTLVLTVAKDIPTGQIWGKAIVRFAGVSTELPIELRGLVLPANLKVIDLNDPKYQQPSVAGPANGDLTQQIKNAVAPRPTSAPKNPPPLSKQGATLHWSVQNESGVYGYIVYRASAEDGPYKRVNDDIVRGSGSNDPANYNWHDGSPVKGETYWYYLGVVFNNGLKKQLTGPQKVVAK